MKNKPEIFSYIVGNGKTYKPALLPEGIPRGDVGDCYDVCILAAMKGPYRYVEGIAQRPLHPYDWILHSWLTDGEHAFDPTWQAFSGTTEIAVPTKYIGIEPDLMDVVRFMRDTEHKGIFANAMRFKDHALRVFPGLPLTKRRI